MSPRVKAILLSLEPKGKCFEYVWKCGKLLVCSQIFKSICIMFIAFFKTIKFLVWIYDVRVMDMEVGGCRIATEFWNYVAKEL